MPVLETAKRKQELQELEGRRDQLVEALRNEDWVERFADSPDFKKFKVSSDISRKAAVEQKEKIIALLSMPVESRDRRDFLNYALNTASTIIQTIDDIVGAPSQTSKHLVDARKELPDLEKRIEKLKEGI